MLFRVPPVALALLLIFATAAGAAEGTAAGKAASGARPVQAVKGLCAAAEAGDGAAAFTLARRYLFGIGVGRDRHKGAAWLRAAADRGHADARRMVKLIPRAIGRNRPNCRPGGAPARGLMAPPAEIVQIVQRMAPTYGLDPALVLAVIQAESAYRTDAVSPKDAAGLMQLIPDTAERFAVRDVFDPTDNIRGGMKYLRWLLSYFRGDVNLALAGYNAGEGAVDRYGGIPPYEETRSYVRMIRRLYGADWHPFDMSVASPSAVVPKTPLVAARP